MSSDVDDEQVLPDSLQKLEIVPVCSRSKISHISKQNVIRSTNPFSISSSSNDFDDQISKDLFGPMCINCEKNDDKCLRPANPTECSKTSNGKNWRMHRGNGSNKTINGLNNGGYILEGSVQKRIRFRQREKDKSHILYEKKLTMLRDPIMRSIGQSLYHNSNQRRLCNYTVDTDGSSSSEYSDVTAPFNLVSRECKKNYNSAIDSDFDRSVRGTADTNNVMIRKLQKWQLDDESTVDFKLLVHDCSNMSLSASFRSEELHKTQNFRVLQTSIDSLGITGDPFDATDSLETNLPNFPMHLNSNCSLNNNNSKTSSCSQQARMNSSNCDVTIDELASYFETFVHIPKKMSSMAEMMYI